MTQDTVSYGHLHDEGSNDASFKRPTRSGMKCTCERRAVFGVGDPICRWPYEVTFLWCSYCRVHLLVLSVEGLTTYCERVNAPQNIRVDIGLMEVVLSTEPHYLEFVTEVRPRVEALFQELTSAKTAKPPNKDWD